MSTTNTDGLLATAAAAEHLGCSVAQFRRIVTDAGVAPAEKRSFFVGGARTRGEAHYWSRADLARLRRRKAVKVAQGRKGGAPRITDEARAAKFTARYGDPRAALPDAAEAMFSLNRYTRWDSCSDQNREEILKLKDRFVPLLHKLGFTDRVVAFVLRRPGKGCFDCGGDDDRKGDGLTNAETLADGWSHDNSCQRCNGTGWFRSPREDRRLAFHFTVAGQHFSWVIPDHLAPDVKADEESSGAPRALDAAISMSRGRFAEAKALIRWVIAADLKSERTIEDLDG